jgi:DNA end-binding protein Ku
MWKAALEIGGIRIPVKLYAGVEDRGVHFSLLHRTDRVPVTQRMVDPRDEREVAAEDVRRGLELDEGVFVALDPEELESIEPEASRDIEVMRVVSRAAVDPVWYSRPYLLGPDGPGADYFALSSALEESGKLGVARWVMRSRRYFGVLEPREGRLALISLHAASEVMAADRLEAPGGAAFSKGERDLAEQLVAALEGEFEPSELRDDHRERIEKLIEAKRRGRRFRVKEPEPPRAVRDLGQALQRSLRAVKGRSRAAA